MLPQKVAALQEELLGTRASAASAQAASLLAERQAMRTRSEREADAQTADLVQVRPCVCTSMTMLHEIGTSQALWHV